MADNVSITTGADASVATDDVGGVHYQRVKLVDGTLESSTAIAAGGGVEAGALRVTIASDSTGVLSVDDNGGVLTVDGSGTAGTAATGVVTVQGIASMTPLLVDGSGATQPISGTVTANAGTNLNTSALALESGGNLASITTSVQLLDDAVFVDDTATHSTGSTKGLGVMATATPTDGSVDANDIGMLAMSTDRRLLVDAQIVGQDADITIADGGNAITVDGTVAVTATQLDVDNLNATDDAVAIHGAVGVLTQLDLTNSDPLTVAVVDGTGDQITSFGGGTQYTLGTDTYAEATSIGTLAAAVRRDADTSAVNTDNEVAPLLVDANGYLKVEIFDGGGSHTVDGTVAVSSVGGTVAVTQSGTWDEVGINDSGNSITVDNGGTFAVQATAVGTVADDGITPGAPVMVGGFAISPDGTDPGNVSAEGDVARFRTDLNRRLLVSAVSPRVWSYHENSSSALTDATVVTGVASNSVFVTDIVVSTGAATAMNVFFEESTTTVLGPYYLEATAGRGFALHFNTPKKITAGTTLTVTTSAAIAHSIDVTGYIASV